jgi:hypothetical protein
MTEETKIIEELKKIGKRSDILNEEKFLKCLKIKLSDHIAAHPAINQDIKTPWYFKFSLANAASVIVIPHTIIMPQKTLAIIFIFCFLTMSTIATASQNSLPGETLYPIKILTEDVRSSLAVTPESKAKIQSSFAARRVEEVKAIMEKNEVSPEILDIALDNLHKNTAYTTTIIDEEHEKGSNIAELVKDINDTFNKNTDNLNQIFDHKNNDLKEEESSLENKIKEAKKTDDQEKIISLNTKLDETKKRRKSFESTWDKSKETLSENTHRIEDQLKEKGSSDEDKDQLENNDSQDEKKNEKIEYESINNGKNNDDSEKEEHGRSDDKDSTEDQTTKL